MGITKAKVTRGELGFWTHPEFFEPANGNEYGIPGEYQAWLNKNNLESYELSLECDLDQQEFADKYFDGEYDADVSLWSPTKPDGDGWFIGSIHDTEDGPYCIWLRDSRSDNGGKSTKGGF